MTKKVMRVPTPSPLLTPKGIALSDSEKVEAVADTGDLVSSGGRPLGTGRY